MIQKQFKLIKIEKFETFKDLILKSSCTKVNNLAYL